MTEIQNGELIESLATALETMAFVSLSPAGGPTPAPVDPLHVKIEFAGAGKGYVELIASQGLGHLLLDNTLSCGPSENAELPSSTDALVELVNITCGILLKRRNAERKYEMRIPQPRPLASDYGWDALVNEGGFDVVLADEFAVAVRVVEE